ncbi:MAG: signal peptide peptidase SppA [Phycisphaerae bacterium]
MVYSTRLGRCVRTLIMIAMSAAVATVTGCTGSSLLITPVAHRRALVETELSRDSRFAVDKIALVDVSGVITNAPRHELFGEGEHPVSVLLEQLDKARRDRRVKAVVLRINSPGGTVTASELMHDEITHFKKSGKPIIAVMMDVATSGAYYIACACDEIVAQPSTVTGSIGVVMQVFDLSGTMQMVGVKSEAIISGTYKDIGSPLRPMRPEERELFEQVVHDMYERFIDVVLAARTNLDEATVRRLADGRIYTATQAKEAGLIDRIATMRDAIDLAKQRAGVKRTRLVTYHRPLGYRPNYYAQTPYRSGGDVNFLKFDLPDWLSRPVPQFMYLWIPGLY